MAIEDQLEPLSSERSRSTLVTPTSSLALHVIAWLEAIAHTSPPFGTVSVTVGGVRSPARRVAHSEPFRNSRLSWPEASAQPGNTVSLPGAVPSSAGELSPTNTMRPLP